MMMKTPETTTHRDTSLSKELLTFTVCNNPLDVQGHRIFTYELLSSYKKEKMGDAVIDE
ncbi:hypothetical protein [Halalkalibacter kiskunsagensis]